jgi:hypothetical protein
MVSGNDPFMNKEKGMSFFDIPFSLTSTTIINGGSRSNW